MTNMPRTEDVENKRGNGIRCVGCQNWKFWILGLVQIMACLLEFGVLSQKLYEQSF